MTPTYNMFPLYTRAHQTLLPIIKIQYMYLYTIYHMEAYYIGITALLYVPTYNTCDY